MMSGGSDRCLQTMEMDFTERKTIIEREKIIGGNKVKLMGKYGKIKLYYILKELKCYSSPEF